MIYQRTFLLIAGLTPTSDQSRVTMRIRPDTSSGAVPQIRNPRPGELGLPPNNGPIQAITVTRNEKITMNHMVCFRSASFMLSTSFVDTSIALRHTIRGFLSDRSLVVWVWRNKIQLRR